MKHGHRKGAKSSPTYSTWHNMRQRCNNPKATKYPWYGAKGVRVCEAWNTFAGFLADMGERPEGLTLDRIEASGDYEPGNCRWADSRTQYENKRQPPIDAETEAYLRDTF